MHLSISNIAWDTKWNHKMYKWIQEKGFSGLEIAPTKLFSKYPYRQLEMAYSWKQEVSQNYGLKISSIQSIWYGREENIFRSEEERKCLLLIITKILQILQRFMSL